MSEEIQNMMNGWASIKEAAKRTGYSREHLRELCRDGKVRAMKVNPRAWLVDVEDVIDYKLYRTHQGKRTDLEEAS